MFLVWASLTNIALYIIDSGLVSQILLKDRIRLTSINTAFHAFKKSPIACSLYVERELHSFRAGTDF